MNKKSFQEAMTIFGSTDEETMQKRTAWLQAAKARQDYINNLNKKGAAYSDKVVAYDKLHQQVF